MTYSVQRDFIGYGANPPDPHWPGGAKLAVNFVINYEEGSEPSIGDGDAATETGVSDAAGGRGVQGRDLAAESMFEYGARAGFWRLLRIFADHGMAPTIFACALALERNPAAAEAIRTGGLDICCHGWRWENHFALTEAQERDRIAMAVTSLIATTGAPPVGWYCRYSPSENTRRLLVEHGGFAYDSDSYADDLPFWTRVGETPHLVVPYSLTTNDTKMMSTAGTSDLWFAYMRDAFDLLLAEGRAGQPKMMNIGLHMRMIGQPARAMGLVRLLDHIAKRRSEVWIAPRSAIARHWAQTHPAA
ncbi:peptidoglycan/xylan/chitin deacetylase (PgdA/CDA1 family) [Humitalea rosea]|uniref:Chitooligosaccharide deacetylase n=1 Tax=Humitalea rosea TaxID=990373 RepID=A0A2W7HZ76_9PROT|nr:polysaccharide deacetylase family protein [Humitalea rosea]PZW39836.1 peptidoglycan/xylan/chitin deacetylase (PgdA/CDA1 family) [Humitalea rosea]